MIPSKEEVLAQLVLLWELRNEVEPVEPITMGGLAGELMYPAVFMINALNYGVTQGVLEHDYETDVVKVIKRQPEVTYMGKEVQSLVNTIEDVVRHYNGKEEDLSLGLMQTWCVGVRPSAAELALRRLVLDGVLSEYRLTDPKDSKSHYDFYTLAENVGKQWGKKQFKSESKK
jgi:hypothetical protein